MILRSLLSDATPYLVPYEWEMSHMTQHDAIWRNSCMQDILYSYEIWRIKWNMTHFDTGWRRLMEAFSCRLFFAKEPLIIGLFCGKWPIKIRNPMGLRHPVPRRALSNDSYLIWMRAYLIHKNTWLIRYMRRDSFDETWLMHIRRNMRYDSFDIWDVTRLMRHDSCI